MAVNIVFGTVCLPEESFKRHFNLPGACFLPVWNYSRNKFDFPVTVVKLLLALAFIDYFSPSPILLRNLLLFRMTPAVSSEKKLCEASMNYWHVETDAGVTCVAFSLTSESHSALWGKMICLCGGVHVSSVELLSVRNSRDSRIHRSFTGGDVASATGIQHSLLFKGNLGKWLFSE